MPETTRPAIRGTTHMVSAGHYLAAAAAYRVLEAGGNAVDAGVASGIAINVLLPDNTSFGGVAPIMIYQAATDTVVTVSGLGRWPQAATAGYFLQRHGGDLPVGILRAVVPAAADAWLTALRLYGTMTLAEVIEPALELAEAGFPVTPSLHAALAADLGAANGVIRQWPSTREIFAPAGRAPEVGEVLVQRDLARTFRRLLDAERDASGGREAGIQAARELFYRGEIAAEMVRFSEDCGGLLARDDLAGFAVGVEAAVAGRFRNHTIYACGPWCQGPVVPQVLQMLEGDDLAALGHNSADYVHLVASALDLAFSDRHHLYGDPDFVDVPIDTLLAPAYTRERRAAIDMARAFGAMPPPGLGPEAGAPATAIPGAPEHDTSYTCVVDRWGNAFSATPSDSVLHTPIVPGLGLAISGRGSQSWLDGKVPARVAPGWRPRLTPNPGMVFGNGRLLMPFGGPGGDSQPQAMVQTFLAIAVFGMEPQLAVEQPRFVSANFPNSFWPHVYHPGALSLEGRIDPAVAEALAARGHRVRRVRDWEPMSMAAMSAILVDHERGTLTAGADPRRDTYAIGR